MLFRPNNKKRAQRALIPISAYIGSNGAGKTLAAVRDTIPTLKAGRRVLSTVQFLDPETGEPHPQCELLTSWQQLLDFRDGDVILDEVQNVANSRQHGSLPPAIVTLFMQLRRRDCVLRWTAPSYARADLLLREVTKSVTLCKGAFPERDDSCAEDCDQDHEHIKPTAWRPNRVFYWRTYDQESYDDWSEHRREDGAIKADVRELYVRTRDPERAQDWYDSLAEVSYIQDALETGTCIICGGSRSRPKCKGHQGEELPRARAASTAAPHGDRAAA